MEGHRNAKYQCCICKGSLSENDPRQHRRDPCSLTIRSSIDRGPRDRLRTQYYCHVDCFAKLVGGDPFDYADEADPT